ncbi:MAG: carbohydrate ABC transporter permease [Erysipelotrichaceae bacterium]|jgi:multiple sugar transport system permease protein|nr:carbohydrate ABC transporter permease [Erysipelotrichaceae bacterium]
MENTGRLRPLRTSVEIKLRRQKVFKIIRNILVYTALVIVSFFMLVPFYWMFNTAFKSTNEILDTAAPPALWPREFTPQNFTNVWNYVPSSATLKSMTFWNYLLNTLTVAVFSIVLGTIATIIVAFCLARLNFKGKNLLFTILLATMMIPGEMMVISNYKTISTFSWVGEGSIPGGPFYAMIVPFLIGVFNIFMLRNTFKMVPNELYYAAKVDGVSDFKYCLKIMIPMAKSAIVTIVILKLMGTWNSYIWPNLVTITEPRFRLVTNWLRLGFVIDDGSGQTRTLVNYQMTAAIIVTVPLLLLFIFFRKYIMSGVSRSGIKG